MKSSFLLLLLLAIAEVTSEWRVLQSVRLGMCRTRNEI